VPARLLMALPQKTGVLVVSPDGRTPLYSALYDGDALASVASAVPTSGGVYLANEALGPERQAEPRVVRLKWPTSMQTASGR
jgi:hypothetical protein